MTITIDGTPEEFQAYYNGKDGDKFEFGIRVRAIIDDDPAMVSLLRDRHMKGQCMCKDCIEFFKVNKARPCKPDGAATY